MEASSDSQIDGSDSDIGFVPFVVGRQVRVNSGILTGIEGTIVEVNWPGLLKIAIGQGVYIEVMEESVSPRG